MSRQSIRKAWLDAKNPGAFSSISTFIKNNPQFGDKQKVNNTLLSLKTAAVHHPKRKTKIYPRVIASGGKGFTWAADLIDYSRYKTRNRNYSYILCVMCIFSKYLYVVPLKKKTGAEIVTSFKKLFSEHKPPKFIWWDGEKATKSKVYKDLMTSNGVTSFQTFSNKKSAFIERKIREIKGRLEAIFTESKRKVWIDKINDVAFALNNTYLPIIKMRPVDVNEKNEGQVFQTLYNDVILNYDKVISAKLKVGDRVRIQNTKLIFQKG